MKKALVIFGALLLVLVAGIAVSVRWAVKKGRRLDQVTHEYADASIVAVVSNWNQQALLDRASPQLLERIHEQNDLQQVFTRWKGLGKLVKYEGATGQANLSVNPKTGIVISALYLANAKFEHGTATIRIALIRGSTGWRIVSFSLFGVPEAIAPAPAHPLKLRHGVATASG